MQKKIKFHQNVQKNFLGILFFVDFLQKILPQINPARLEIESSYDHNNQQQENCDVRATCVIEIFFHF